MFESSWEKLPRISDSQAFVDGKQAPLLRDFLKVHQEKEEHYQHTESVELTSITVERMPPRG